VGLHRLGSLAWLRVDWAAPGLWLQTVAFLDALAAIARTAGLVACYWLLTTTCLYMVAEAAHIGAMARALAWATLPVARDWARRAVASGVLTASLALPAAAWEQVKPGYVPVAAGDQQTTTTTIAAPTPTTTVATIPVVPATVATPTSNAAPVSSRVEVTVQPGDNFWRLAENRLRELIGREPSDSEVAPSWVNVVEANRHSIRSGNPDLIFPGEVVLLPDLSG
jgi:hypothetical protein